MRIRILHFILFSCLVIGCTSKSSKKGMVNFDSIQIVKPIFVYDTQRNNYQDGIAVKKSINETRNLQTLGNQKFSAVTKQLDIITGNESFEDLMKSYCEAK